MVRLTETTELAARQPGGPGVQPLAARRSGRRAAPRAVLRLHDRAARRARCRRRTSSIPRASGRSRRRRSCAAGCCATAGRRNPAELGARRRSTSACPTGRWRTGPASARSFPGAHPKAPRPRPARWWTDRLTALDRPRRGRPPAGADAPSRGRLLPGDLPQPATPLASRRPAAVRLDRHPLSPSRRHLERLAPGRVGRGLASLRRRAAAAAPAGPWRGRLDRDDPQAVVPAGVWQAAEPVGDAVLCGCTVAPGFEFADFELGRADALVAELSGGGRADPATCADESRSRPRSAPALVVASSPRGSSAAQVAAHIGRVHGPSPPSRGSE